MRPENVETDGSVAVDVGMVDSSGECKFWRFEGIVCGEVNVEEKHSTYEIKIMMKYQ